MSTRTLRRALLAPAVFAGVLALHFLWFSHYGPQARWVALDDEPALSLRPYLESQSAWLGLSYAISLTFAAHWLRRYREQRLCSASTLTVGSVTLSGAFAVGGCYVLGCCGSPMLGVYLGLFGATFLPFRGPIVFAVTTVLLAGSWWWMSRASRRASESDSACPAVCSAGGEPSHQAALSPPSSR